MVCNVETLYTASGLTSNRDTFVGLNMVNSSQWPKMNKYSKHNTKTDDDDVFMVGFLMINFISNVTI